MKTMIITGASSGVGRALAIHFAGQDWNIAAIGRSAERLQDVKYEYPNKIDTYICDISKSSEVRKTFDTIISKFPVVDVLINNAGIVTGGNMDNDELSVIDLGIDVNLKGTMYCTGAVVPTMKKAKAGLIINIASIAGLPGGLADQWIDSNKTKFCTYGTTKAGIIFFTESLAKQLLPSGVRATCLCPGAIATPLWENQGGYPDNDAKIMTTDDMNNLVQFLVDQPDNILYKNMTMFPVNDWK